MFRRTDPSDVLYLELDEFMLELKEGSFKNVGPATKEGTAKLYDVVEGEARVFGDERVKFSFTDEDGNQVEVALSPDIAGAIAEDVASLRDAGEEPFDEE